MQGSPTDPALRRALIADLVSWHAEMGVDAAIDDAPHDRFAEAAEEAAARSARQARGPQARGSTIGATAASPASSAPASPAAPALSAREEIGSAERIADAAPTLEALREAWAAFEGCALKRTANRHVFADGNPLSRVMIVGEAPGADEDAQGRPFVGRAGQLLDRMLGAIGLDRTSVYIANIVPWRPPGNRTPTTQEIAVCTPFVRRQIALSAAEILVCVGNVPTQALLAQKGGITQLRGRWFDYSADGRTLRALPTLHTSYLLRQPMQKRFAWQDMLTLKAALDQAASSASA
jgi:DNA polymerase